MSKHILLTVLSVAALNWLSSLQDLSQFHGVGKIHFKISSVSISSYLILFVPTASIKLSAHMST